MEAKFSNPLFMILFYLFQNHICSIVANDPLDFRFVSYNETLRNVQIYQENDDSFDAITIDPQRDQIIIGAKNAIIRLSLHNFHLLERFKWESSANEINMCRSQIQTFNQCENYVRVLAIRSRDQLLLACGTNSYRPICMWRRLDSLSTIIPNENFISGDGKSPYNSQFPSTYNLIDTGEFYSATSNEPVFGVNDPLIQRSFSQGKQLRTQQHDSNWLRNPYFVRILDIGSYVYTFFREIALEHLSCGTTVYSRVARVCKYDDGTMKFSDTFRSFSKLRLSCSKKINNEITSFDYNELQSVFFDQTSNLIYGAFNLPRSGLSGSAICTYKIDDLQRIFASPYLTQKSNESYWLPSTVKQESEKCEPNQSNENLVSSGPVLQSGVLQSSYDALTLDNIRIGHLLINHFYDITILFVITDDSLVLRKYSLINNQQLCLIEHIQLKPTNTPHHQWKINKAEFILETKEIVMTTTISVVKLSVARCDRFNTSNLCLSAMDPYCTWDNNQQRCILFTKSSSTFPSSRPLLTCPIINTTIDGGWASWSSWFTCEQVTGEKCQCRTRTCTQPTPQFGGRLCQGSNVEITRCEVHGGFSSWSEWSLCSKTCGKSYRSRTRTCTNPEPKNNGRLCIGAEREEELCPEIVCSEQSSRLSSWTDWDTCSRTCGGGIQKRRRTCLSNGDKCLECLEETRLCNESPCPIQQITLWSDWTPTINPIKDGLITEQRTRFVCTIGSSSGQQLPEITSDTVMYRVCNNQGGNDCQETDSLDNLNFDDWSPWSVWSECYPACDIPGSIETRRRTCLGKRCSGNDIEKRECLSCTSLKSSNWSCWTDWSECSLCASSRLRSIKYRTRICFTNSCQGESREERLCSSCPLLLKSFPLIDSISEMRFTLIHIILVSLISFLFGCLLMLCIIILCRYRRRRLHSHFKHRQASNTFLHADDRDYFQASTSNSSSSPHTAQDSDTFTTLSNTNNNTNKFRSFDSSSSSTNGGVSAFLKEIPSRKLNMYINPREMPPLPPAATLKRTSLMSSMKTNLDADDL
ncbi:unnamed protein product [Rotaria magnacalcarata]|uniref:Sema domain-containing protein n=10 Tax=Rotaria TaxID=231623 RepID=A0A815AMT3_9BILA|nr:unnamed protein product [Rotaria magnacalcarata]CAF1303592.1 unnamed protein product [Rotaria magnacalcarata]CAF2220507.1 unnamed protein product [Rotaria magnacalcarata]